MARNEKVVNCVDARNNKLVDTDTDTDTDADTDADADADRQRAPRRAGDRASCGTLPVRPGQLQP